MSEPPFIKMVNKSFCLKNAEKIVKDLFYKKIMELKIKESMV